MRSGEQRNKGKLLLLAYLNCLFRAKLSIGFFGGNSVDIRPQGSAELIFSLRINQLDNPSLPESKEKPTSFDFEEKIQMNVMKVKLEEKLKLTTNYNTESTFDFENQMKLEYTGRKMKSLKKLEVGNVSLPLNGTLIGVLYFSG